MPCHCRQVWCLADDSGNAPLYIGFAGVSWLVHTLFSVAPFSAPIQPLFSSWSACVLLTRRDVVSGFSADIDSRDHGFREYIVLLVLVQCLLLQVLMPVTMMF